MLSRKPRQLVSARTEDGVNGRNFVEARSKDSGTDDMVSSQIGRCGLGAETVEDGVNIEGTGMRARGATIHDLPCQMTLMVSWITTPLITDFW